MAIAMLESGSINQRITQYVIKPIAILCMKPIPIYTYFSILPTSSFVQIIPGK
jgi:hypothetical protein